MTPFEINLDNDLDIEAQRFANEWLFYWHNLNIKGRKVDLDRFDGGRITYGGIKFGDQQQQVFWQAIGRYLNQKILEAFRAWDASTSAYPLPARRSSIDGVAQRLRQFVAQVITQSTDTDRALRGAGYPEQVQPFDSASYLARMNSEISKLGDAHKALIDQAPGIETRAPDGIVAEDAKLRGIFLMTLYSLRDNAGGWVPISESNFSESAPITRGKIASTGRYLAESGYINWKTLTGDNEGFVAGTGQITAAGIRLVEGTEAAKIPVNLPRNATVPSVEAKAFPAEQQVNIESRLLARPREVRDAAVILARALRDQIAEAQSYKPNDEEGLKKHSAFVDYLDKTANELDQLATTLNDALDGGSASSPNKIFIGKAEKIVTQLGIGFSEWLEANRANVAGYAVKVAVFAAGFSFLTAIGVDAAISTVLSGILSKSFPNEKAAKKE
jgi:hypothetical protein